jgi:hypothetical protein
VLSTWFVGCGHLVIVLATIGVMMQRPARNRTAYVREKQARVRLSRVHGVLLDRSRSQQQQQHRRPPQAGFPVLCHAQVTENPLSRRCSRRCCCRGGRCAGLPSSSAPRALLMFVDRKRSSTYTKSSATRRPAAFVRTAAVARGRDHACVVVEAQPGAPLLSVATAPGRTSGAPGTAPPTWS